jgi:hypothetical protein
MIAPERPGNRRGWSWKITRSKESIMEITATHAELIADVLRRLPTDENGMVKIHPHALTDRFANAMAPHAHMRNTLDRFRLVAQPEPHCACGTPWHAA